jgi:hypothetical protein
MDASENSDSESLFDRLDDECIREIYFSLPDVFTCPFRATCRRMRDLLKAPNHITLRKFALNAAEQNCIMLLEYAIIRCKEYDVECEILIKKQIFSGARRENIPESNGYLILPLVEDYIMARAIKLHRPDLLEYCSLGWYYKCNKYCNTITALAQNGYIHMLPPRFWVCLDYGVELESLIPGVKTKYKSKEWYYRLELFKIAPMLLREYMKLWVLKYNCKNIPSQLSGFEFFDIFTQPQLTEILETSTLARSVYDAALKNLKKDERLISIVKYLERFIH